jgi:DNA-binding PadR family transcriptional regulator
MKNNKQKKYFKTEKGKETLKNARKAYDERDPERRRKQKREYMRRKRAKNPFIWR